MNRWSPGLIWMVLGASVLLCAVGVSDSIDRTDSLRRDLEPAIDELSRLKTRLDQVRPGTLEPLPGPVTTQPIRTTADLVAAWSSALREAGGSLQSLETVGIPGHPGILMVSLHVTYRMAYPDWLRFRQAESAGLWQRRHDRLSVTALGNDVLISESIRLAVAVTP